MNKTIILLTNNQKKYEEYVSFYNNLKHYFNSWMRI